MLRLAGAGVDEFAFRVRQGDAKFGKSACLGPGRRAAFAKTTWSAAAAIDGSDGNPIALGGSSVKELIKGVRVCWANVY